VLGEGPVDVVNVPGFMSHLDMQWANPEWREPVESRGARFFPVLRAYPDMALTRPETDPVRDWEPRSALGQAKRFRDGATAAAEMIERVGQPATPNSTPHVRPQASSSTTSGRP
jgi:hypothetical protein